MNSGDAQSWGRDLVGSTFFLVCIYLVALETSKWESKKISAKARQTYRKHTRLSCSVNYPVKSRLWNPLTVWHLFPTKFMFSKAQLNVTQENSPSRDVGQIVHPLDQHRTTQFPVCVRRLKCLVKPKWFLITSCRIALSFTFFFLPLCALWFSSLLFVSLGLFVCLHFVIVYFVKIWFGLLKFVCPGAGCRLGWHFVVIYHLTAFLRMSVS